jgi:hypothetical protein
MSDAHSTCSPPRSAHRAPIIEVVAENRSQGAGNEVCHFHSTYECPGGVSTNGRGCSPVLGGSSSQIWKGYYPGLGLIADCGLSANWLLFYL